MNLGRLISCRVLQHRIYHAKKGSGPSLLPLRCAHPLCISNRAKECRQARNYCLALGPGTRIPVRQAAQNFGRGNAGSDFIDGGESHGSVRCENKHSRLGNTPFFARIKNSPLRHDTPLRVRQNRKWKSQLPPRRFRFLRSIDRNGHHIRPCRPKRWI